MNSTRIVLGLFVCLLPWPCMAQPQMAYPAMRMMQFDQGMAPGMRPPRYQQPYYPGGRPFDYGVPPAGTAIRGTDPSWTQHLIKKEDRAFDFGTVAKGTQVEHEFVLKNKFVETVHIVSVSSSCTCTTPYIKDGKSELQTHDETAIIAHFHTDRFDGMKSATITVVIDRPYFAEIQLNVRGEIRSDISITPNSVQFGPVKEGAEASRTLSVVYTGSVANWKLIDIRSDNEHLKGEILDTQARPGMVTTKIKVVLDDKAPKGDLSERLLLVSNDIESRREIPLSVQGRIGTTIHVTPSTVFLGFLKPGERSPTKTVTLRGTQPFKIVKLLCNNPEVQVEFEPKPDAPPRVFYSFGICYTNPTEGNAAPKDGKMQALVRVETDNPDLSPTFNVTMELAK